MTSKELRQKYLEFFKTKEHSVIPSASLIPENDPTVLFTTAGMHPLVPYLMGENHPGGQRVANCQKCIRTGDIDEVGDATHHTFFEMLGNWSLGDYFKKDAIKWSWEFLTSKEWLNLDKNRIAISVFAGDADAPFDKEAHNIWLSLGVPENKIARLPKKNNWWGPAGITGPCGPDTEMFYWAGPADKIPKSFNDDNPLWIEIWNDVFMQYNKKADGTYEPLKQKNVDTGMGLERTVAVLNGLDDDYKTDLFKNLIFRIEQLSGKKYGQSAEITKAMRIIADHLKAAIFIMGDDKGVGPSNLGQGYVVRRLIRRAIRYGRQLGIKEDSWTKEIAKVVAHDYQETYPELRRNIDKVIKLLQEEEVKFIKTMEDGLKKAHRILAKKKPLAEKLYFTIMQIDNKKEIICQAYRNKKTLNKIDQFAVSMDELLAATISGTEAFNLYQTYGFPIEMIIELAQEAKLFVDKEEFDDELAKHQALSRTASAGMFKGGLADASEATVKYHTAAHLLLAALRKVLGNHVIQKGSNITAERLRFDFAHNQKMTEAEKQRVEELVNQAIKQNLPVACETMSLEQAKAEGAHGIFDAKYGERVNIYTIGLGKLYFSKEICGGPHVNYTGKLGRFKIQKEESSSAGVRRIKAILE